MGKSTKKALKPNRIKLVSDQILRPQYFKVQLFQYLKNTNAHLIQNYSSFKNINYPFFDIKGICMYKYLILNAFVSRTIYNHIMINTGRKNNLKVNNFFQFSIFILLNLQKIQKNKNYEYLVSTCW